MHTYTSAMRVQKKTTPRHRRALLHNVVCVVVVTVPAVVATVLKAPALAPSMLPLPNAVREARERVIPPRQHVVRLQLAPGNRLSGTGDCDILGRCQKGIQTDEHRSTELGSGRLGGVAAGTESAREGLEVSTGVADGYRTKRALGAQ